ncbi:hypothetical protein ABIE91_001699 [Bradyrhizobium elkanii]
MNETARISVVPLLAEHDRRPWISLGVAAEHADIEMGPRPILVAAMQQQLIAQPMNLGGGDRAVNSPEDEADPPDGRRSIKGMAPCGRASW